MPSLLHLDEQLLAIPEDDSCCSASGGSFGPGGGLPALPAPPRRWVEALEAVEAARAAPLPDRPHPLRKCASTPTLHSMTATCERGEPAGMEVYVVLRCFKEFGGGLFNRLPRRLRNGVRDAGICHYLAVFKQRDGSLVQFDFGPRGGDIHVSRGPFAFLSKSADGKMQRLVPGEVRCVHGVASGQWMRTRMLLKARPSVLCGCRVLCGLGVTVVLQPSWGCLVALASSSALGSPQCPEPRAHGVGGQTCLLVITKS